ncbi:hypothetical protein ACRPOS_007550 [Bartonella heixiaziensis]|uniref:hypothetical protein n=1 Tax=Bartonella heixiaziensis TaxID=1461000 RepID=UPI0039088D1A
MRIDESLKWLLRCEKLKLPQAALLIAGLNPNICIFNKKTELEESDIYVGRSLAQLPKVALFRAVYKEIIRAGKEGKLTIEWFYTYPMVHDRLRKVLIVEDSSVSVANLKEWLLSQGMRPKLLFFEDDCHEMKDQKYTFQDPTHPRYAPKLAAVVAAWEAVTEVAPGEIVKQTLKKWLQDNASQYNLFNKKTGKRSDDVIEQLASVANWKPTGGAPKTIAKVPLEQKKDAKKE